MTAFVESCLETVADSALEAERKARGRPRATKLLQALLREKKRNILVTTHQHPDPDALASALGMHTLLSTRLPSAAISLSIKGRVGGGVNEAFVRQSNLKFQPWDDAALKGYDAIILLDTQPTGSFSPLPPDVTPFAVIDHHRTRGGRRPKCPFCDIRPDVGSTSSIVFSYFMELEVPIRPDLGATLLYAIESDLAGAAGQPGELDNLALSSLTLIADTRKLYQMRYVDLPQSYFVSYFNGLSNAVWAEDALMSHIETIDSLERPAILADFLLRFDQARWALVTAVHDDKLVMSLRTQDKATSAADVIRRLLRHLGEGGGHRTKAGGFVKLETGSAAEIERVRKLLWNRYLRALGHKPVKGQKLVTKDTPGKASS